MRVIVGLGNPGMRYARTRHNIGFRVVNAFAEEQSAARVKKTTAYHLIQTEYNGEPVALIKPQLFMNRSGTALSRAPFNFHGSNDSLLVVFDDASLAFGALRFRAAGSAGGHKGLKDIIDTLGTNEVHRLKIGIGQNRDMPLEDYVLRPFTRAETQQMPDIIDDAVRAISFYLDNDIQTAMTRFNTKNKE